MNRIMNPDYVRFYKIYKKLPGILAITILVLAFAWSVIDISVFQSVSYYGRYTRYGIMHLDSAFLAMIIWWAIGAVLAGISWFFSALTVSAIVARTDAVIAINDKMQNEKMQSDEALS